MFCPKCGAQNDDAWRFCAVCRAELKPTTSVLHGVPMSGAPTPGAPMPGAPAGGGGSSFMSFFKNKRNILIMAAAAVAVVLLVVILCFAIGCETDGYDTYEEMPEAVVEAVMDADPDGILGLIPGQIYDLAEEQAHITRDDLNTVLEIMLEVAMENVRTQVGEDIEFRLDIGRVYDMDMDEIRDIRERYYTVLGGDMEISDAKRLELWVQVNNISAGGYMPSSLTESFKVNVIQVDGSWYLDITSLDF